MILLFEVEIKAKIRNISRIKEKINELGAIQKKIINMEDIYFKHPNRDFAITDEALRIRITENMKFLTYKGPKIDKLTKTREEIEISIENSDKLKIILKKLGFIEVPKIKKQREIYEINDISICFDDVEFIGKFIEIETSAKDEQERVEKLDKLINFAKKIGIEQKDFIRKSYLELVKNKMKDYIE